MKQLSLPEPGTVTDRSLESTGRFQANAAPLNAPGLPTQPSSCRDWSTFANDAKIFG